MPVNIIMIIICLMFFEEFEIQEPDYNLGISGRCHGKMADEILIKFE